MLDYDLIESQNMTGSLRDWRKALRAPTRYRVGNAVRVQSQYVLCFSLLTLFVLIIFYYFVQRTSSDSVHKWSSMNKLYNNTYPLTKAVSSNGALVYRIGIIADLDTESKVDGRPNTWYSYLMRGYLSYNAMDSSVVVSWDTQQPTILTSSYSLKGRGMELSELVVYDGRLLTFDDRSGMVYEVVGNKVIPWILFIDGNGKSEKGFKTEWATVRGEVLYAGSMGKEWTTPGGQFESDDPMWIKAVNVNGEVQHLNWAENFKALRSTIGIEWPGYMIHESGVWSPHSQRWYFLPRRCSKESYNETRDEVMGCNYLITADSSFTSIKSTKIVPHSPRHGFSSFKFIPGSEDKAIVALRTTEFHGKTETYIIAFTVEGKILLKETLVANHKYEGLEFI